MKYIRILHFGLFFSIIIFSVSLFGQGSAGTRADQEYSRLIDMRTAGMLKSGNLGFNINVLKKGVLITEVNLSVFKNFSIGLSYGASNFIGIGKPEYYKNLGINTKLRLFTENRALPSFTIGFDNQGKGLYIDSLDRYEIKSPGIYVSILKNFKLLGYFSLHGQLNYSLESGDDERNLNFAIGIEKTIGPFLSFIAEYDFALNDNSKRSLGDGKGYLNAGVRWAVSRYLTLGFDFKDILNNNNFEKDAGPERALYFEYFTNLY